MNWDFDTNVIIYVDNENLKTINSSPMSIGLVLS
jgi:hypothetical protein